MSINYAQIPSPCYVLEEVKLRKNLELIRSVKEAADIEIILAFKSFALWKAFPIFREYISGATASSIYEAQLCFEEMGALAHTYSPSYTSTDFQAIMRYSSHITFNSLSQYKQFAPTLSQAPHPISAGLRINPEHSSVGTDLYNPCSPGSRLGVTATDIGATLPQGIEGLHFHTLCESNATDLENTLRTVEEKFGHLFHQIKWINMGGGHLMTHKEYDTKHLITLLKDFKKRTGLNIILEPGSAFTWQTGFLLSTVTDIVSNHGINTAILDVSFTAHMPDCLEMPYKPTITNAIDPPQSHLPTYRMGGNSCLSGDFYGDWSFQKPLQPGQHLIFEDMIHYTMVKTNMFNGVPHPAIGLLDRHNQFILYRQFNYTDFKNRMS